MSKPTTKPPGFKVIMGPFKTGAGKFLIVHSAISLQDAKAGNWVKRPSGHPDRRYIVKEKFYKTQEMALRQRNKAIQKGWNDFYSANLPQN